MAKRSLLDRLINLSDITETLTLIEGSNTDYITPSGKIYKDYGNGKMFPKKNTINKNNGYLYCGITMSDGTQKQFRVHKLVALAYLPNPNNYPYVCHKDDNKANPHVDNLEWGDASKNTKDAFDRGLVKNAKGYEDSQSIPVYAFTMNKQVFQDYGSVGEAARALKVTKTTILNQCNHNVKTHPRCGYYFRYKEEYDKLGFVL